MCKLTSNSWAIMDFPLGLATQISKTIVQ